MTYWKKLNKDLSGQNGFVYLMFLGRETTGEAVAEELSTTQILATPEDQVYAAIKSLEKNNYLRFIRKEGRYKIRTANLDPMIETFECFGMPFSEKVVTTIGKYLGNFPKYVSRILEAKAASIRGKEWSYLSKTFYMTFLDNLATLLITDHGTEHERLPFGSGKLMKMVIWAYAKSFGLPKKSRARVNQAHELLREILGEITPEDKRVLGEYAKERAWSLIKDMPLISPEDKEDFLKTVDKWLS